VAREDLGDSMTRHFPRLARDKDGNAIGNILFDFRPIDGNLRKPIDLLPLLNYCKSSPGLQVRRDERVCACETCITTGKNFNLLFAPGKCTKFQAWLDSSVVGIKFCHFDGPVRLHFELRKRHQEVWQIRWNNRGIWKGGGLEEWEASTGLELGEKNLIHFGPPRRKLFRG
jgi:hypothetical protein